MKSIPLGGFHELENNGKLFFVYHHPKYQPIPQTKSPSSDKTANHDLPFQPLFLCPHLRVTKNSSDSLTYPISYSPEYIVSTTKVMKICQYSLCFGVTIKNSMLMVGATYAAAQILAQTIISVSTVIKFITKNACSLQFQSNTLIILSILCSFPIAYLVLPI